MKYNLSEAVILALKFVSFPLHFVFAFSVFPLLIFPSQPPSRCRLTFPVLHWIEKSLTFVCLCMSVTDWVCLPVYVCEVFLTIFYHLRLSREEKAWLNCSPRLNVMKMITVPQSPPSFILFILHFFLAFPLFALLQLLHINIHFLLFSVLYLSTISHYVFCSYLIPFLLFSHSVSLLSPWCHRFKEQVGVVKLLSVWFLC